VASCVRPGRPAATKANDLEHPGRFVQTKQKDGKKDGVLVSCDYLATDVGVVADGKLRVGN
jgi:hypothetical protein